MGAFLDPAAFGLVPVLEAAFPAILAEVCALAPSRFVASPDSLTAVAGGYDETGWLYHALLGDGAPVPPPADCPATLRACGLVPGLVNAGFSLFRPGTHLYPHHGERPDVLRCHLGLVVPAGDVALRCGDEVQRWQPGRCLVFDDTFEHDAWNRAASDRIVLIVTFRRPPGR